MKNNKKRKGFVFKTYEAENQSPFEKLFEIFKELITHTSGDFDEAIDWMRSLDVEYSLTDKHVVTTNKGPFAATKFFAICLVADTQLAYHWCFSYQHRKYCFQHLYPNMEYPFQLIISNYLKDHTYRVG